MHITHLTIENFRNLETVEIQPGAGLNYFFGENGAGNSSVLEAVFLLSRGKSFRAAGSEELIRHQAESFQVFAETRHQDEIHRIGLERSKKAWRARKNGQDLALLSELSRSLPLVLMEPNSHSLVSGSPELRRRFLDWGVFHVEPLFLDTWRQYSRGLKQRNAALRRSQTSVIDSIDEIIVPLGERLSVYRQAYVDKLVQEFSKQMNSSRDGLKGIRMRFQPGWRPGSLQAAFDSGRERDLEQGISQHGPHRADLLLEREGRQIRSTLSRGEQKNLAACLLLSQAEIMKASGQDPLILLDDLASEFDQRHCAEVLQKALACASQVWVTGIAEGAPETRSTRFHVERGQVFKVL